MKIHTLLLAPMTLVALGCASTAPQTTHYLLPMDLPAVGAQRDSAVPTGLGRVTVASYLAQPGLAIETEAHEIRAARQHLWAEPLEDGLRRFLRNEISKALGYDVGADPTQQRRWERTIDYQSKMTVTEYIDRVLTSGSSEAKAQLYEDFPGHPRLPPR